MKPVGITRVRNESLIIRDTIEHYLGFCDRIYLYDDCSTDSTVAIAREAGGTRIEIIAGDAWITNRVAEETRHRGLLLQAAASDGADWCLCFDADERLVGQLPQNPAADFAGYRFRLFDGYMTPRVQGQYSGGLLGDLNRLWGVEYRDILMLFRAGASKYVGLDKREPDVLGKIQLADIYVKHFGKCLSVSHFEETCDYYINYFPARFSQKWSSRKGKAIHTRSDFGRPLMSWEDLMKSSMKWVKI